LWQYEELTELETSYNSPATELGDVVLLPVADALDETMRAQAFEVSGARDLGHLSPDAHARLAEDIGEVRRMLYRFVQSLNAESG